MEVDLELGAEAIYDETLRRSLLSSLARTTKFSPTLADALEIGSTLCLSDELSPGIRSNGQLPHPPTA